MLDRTVCMCLISCFFYIGCSENRDPYPLETEAVGSVISKAAPMLSKKYKMKTFGTMIAMPGGVVKRLGFRFHVIGPRSVEELRKILIDSSQDFQDMINSNLQIRPFLEVYPFSIDRVEVILFLVDSTRRDLHYPDIGTADIINSVLTFSYFSETSGNQMRNIDVTETYVEALKALESSTGSEKKAE